MKKPREGLREDDSPEEESKEPGQGDEADESET